jgi:uncharacterized metal-binding protein YceD (DUF177 family)
LFHFEEEPMELDVSKALSAPGTEYPFEARVNLPPQDVTGEAVTFDEVQLRGTYSALENRVHVRGTMDTVAHGACALCMRQADIPVHVSFAEAFRKGANEMEDEDFCFEGKTVPLAQMTLTLVMLNLPMRFLCQEDCKGSDELKAWQKKRSSSHEETPVQRPFEALQSLLKKDEEV